MKLTEVELYDVVGGATVTSTFINAASRFITTIFTLGQTVGSAIRRSIARKVCPC